MPRPRQTRAVRAATRLLLLLSALAAFQAGAQEPSRPTLRLPDADQDHDYREASHIAWALSDSPESGALVHEFVTENFDALVERAPRDAAAEFPRWGRNFCSEAQRADLDAWFRERAPKYEGGPRILVQVLERIGLCAAFKQRQQASLSRFLRPR